MSQRKGMDGHVAVSRHDRTVRIVLDRPSRKNALTEPMIDQLKDIVTNLSTDQTSDVVVISGAGTDFCTGADVSDIYAVLALDAAGRSEAFETGMRSTIHPLMRSILDLEQVVVVSARGHAVGLGTALVLAADLTVLSETARLSIPQVALGHTTDHGESYLLPRKVGLARAMQMVLLGERLGAADAERFGLANLVVADDQLEEATAKVTSSLLAGSPTSLRGTKTLLSRSFDRDRESQFAAEVKAVSACAASQDFVIAIEAAMGGRRGP